MIFNVLMIMLALAGGSAPGATDVSTNTVHLPKDECYINGQWYNPCRDPEPDPPPPPDPRDPPIVLEGQ
jgi:hypothetical protein